MTETAITSFAGPFAFHAVWGLLILSAFIGWGHGLHRLAGRPVAQPDWGLLAGWGLAGVLFVGGLMNLAGLVSPGAVTGVVVVGNLMLAVHLIGSPPARPAWRGWGLVLAALIIAPLATRYGAAVAYQALSCSDDDIAYFAFIQRMLQTGSLLDPYSLRRLAGLGGQTFLQALNVGVGSEINAYLLDRGVALIISFGLATGLGRRYGGGGALIYILPLLLVVLLPFPMLNSASHITGLALFLTLLRTLDSGGDEMMAAPRYLWLTGLVVAAAASLRAHFIAVAALCVGIYWLLAAQADRRHWRRHAAALLHTAGAGALALLPWMVVQWQSSGTPLYPLWRGNHRADFENYSAPLGLAGQLEFLAGALISPGIALFCVPIILYALRRPSRAGLALYLASLATVAALAWVFTYSDAANIHRYAAPFLNAAFIATILVFAQVLRPSGAADGGGGRRRWGDLILGGAVVVLLPVMVGKDVARLTDHWGRGGLPAGDRAVYRAMQAGAPEGAGLFAVVSHPFALDYRRNPIAAVDIPGAASPDPGMPFFRGPAALKSYLKDQGITFILHRDFARPGGCLYDRALWTHNRTRADYREGRFQARYYLDLMDNLDALALSEKVRRTAHGLKLIELR